MRITKQVNEHGERESVVEITQEDYERQLKDVGRDDGSLMKPGRHVWRGANSRHSAERRAKLPRVRKEDFAPGTLKQRITICLDVDIIDHFKARGDHYQSEINAALRGIVDGGGAAGVEDLLESERFINRLAAAVAERVKESKVSRRK